MKRLQIDVYLSDQGVLHTMAEDVRRGLTATPKTLPPKYFYDAEGSDLFECITELPEYYPTRTERGLLASVAEEIMGQVCPRELVEVGSGSSSKTRLLLDSRNGADTLALYLPFDISEEMLRASAASLLEEYPSLHVRGVVGAFEQHLDNLPPPTGRRLVAFLGSTIGNLDPPQRHLLLLELRGLLEPDGRLLLGVDLVKDVSILEAAYNDSAGVTAQFNRNILRVVNRGLQADFQPDAFQHQAFFNREEARIEMHLRPVSPQTVQVRDLGLTIEVTPEETIWTESSYKFTHDSVAAMFRDAGLTLERWYTDADNLFGLALASPA